MPNPADSPRCQLALAPAAVGGVLVVALAAGCVSPPRPAGPTTLIGELPSPSVGATATAARAEGAVDGPLRVTDASFAWTHASPTASAFRWSCGVENPSNAEFLVTLVVELLDVDGRALESSSQAFRIGADELVPVSGDGQIEADVASRVTDWRLEYWVRVPPRPIRQ